MKYDRFDIHQHVTDKIPNAIERGAGNFRLPWHRAAGSILRPINIASKKPYRGINVVALWAYAEEFWPVTLPGMQRVVVAVDPSGARGMDDEATDSIGIIVAALGDLKADVMANPAGESGGDALRLDFDRRLMLQFRGSIYGATVPAIVQERCGADAVTWL